MWGKEGYHAPGDPPGCKDRAVGFPQQCFCRAMFAEVRDAWQMLGRPSCSPGLVCLGDESVGWRTLQFHSQSKGWMVGRRSNSVVLSFSRLILAPIRESGAEKGSSLSLVPADRIWSISSPVRGVAGHCSASLGEACMGRLPSWELQERRAGMEAEQHLPWLVLSVSLLSSCEAWGTVSARFGIPTLSSTMGRQDHSLSRPSSSPLPSRSLSCSPFPVLLAACVPLIEDSLSCQPLVSRHAYES